MKTIIAGSRSVTAYADLLRAIDECGWDITRVVSGTAMGADKLGEQWAFANDVPVSLYKPAWGRLGKRAGFIRNTQMAEHSEALLALWDGESKGTKHMIDIASKKGLVVYVYHVD